MNLETIILTTLGSGSFFAFIQYLVGRYDNKNSKLTRIEHKIDTTLGKCERNELATTRLQLLFLIRMQPENKDAILQTAQRYFMELDGNGEAWDAFKHWCKEMDVDSSYFHHKKGKYGTTNQN